MRSGGDAHIRLRLPAWLVVAGILWTGWMGSICAQDPEATNVQFPQIVGGQNAAPGAYPWIAVLVEAGTDPLAGQFCGGALVSSQWVATAAHCVSGETPDSIEVGIGAFDLRQGVGQRFAVESIRIHPAYDAETGDSDIALVRLVGSSSSRVIVPLPTVSQGLASPGRTGKVLGWGATEASGDAYADVLQQVDLPIVSNEVCNEPQAYDGEITSNMLCAGVIEGGKDACAGDSGGPLIVPSGSGHFLAGIISWGDGCAQPYKYGVYVRVSNFGAWIRSVVEEKSGSNQRPTAEAGADLTVKKKETVRLAVAASDPDGDPLTFKWEQLSGPRVTIAGVSQAQASFVAPSLHEEATLLFEVTVSDGKGGEARDQVKVKVLKNNPPRVEVIPSQRVVAQDTVYLKAVASDPDGDALGYEWRQTAGPAVTLLGSKKAEASFRAPLVPFEERIDLQVTVSDDISGVVTAVNVFVLPRLGLMVPTRLGSRIQTVFVGASIVNLSDSPSQVKVAYHAADGRLDETTVLSEMLGARSQTSFLASELPGMHEGVSLMLVDGIESALNGMFLVGTNDRKRLDGVGGELKRGKALYAPLLEGAETVLNLLNPDQLSPVDVSVEVIDPQGVLQESKSIRLEPLGIHQQSLEQFFGVESARYPAYLRILSSGHEIAAFTLAEGAGSFAAVEGLPSWKTSKLLAPHFFSNSGGSSRLHLINSSEGTVEVEVRGVNDSGQALAEAKVTLDAGRYLDENIVDLLGLAIPSQGVSGYLEILAKPVGWLAVYDDLASLSGCISFTTNNGKARASLPLVEQRSRESNLLYVAQSDEVGLFMGLAVVNDSSESVNVTLDMYDARGKRTGEKKFLLGPKRRVIDLLNGNKFFGSGVRQVGGHVRIRSDQPIATFALYGDFKGEFLAAVQSQIVLQ